MALVRFAAVDLIGLTSVLRAKEPVWERLVEECKPAAARRRGEALDHLERAVSGTSVDLLLLHHAKARCTALEIQRHPEQALRDGARGGAKHRKDGKAVALVVALALARNGLNLLRILAAKTPPPPPRLAGEAAKVHAVVAAHAVRQGELAQSLHCRRDLVPASAIRFHHVIHHAPGVKKDAVGLFRHHAG